MQELLFIMLFEDTPLSLCLESKNTFRLPGPIYLRTGRKIYVINFIYLINKKVHNYPASCDDYKIKSMAYLEC